MHGNESLFIFVFRKGAVIDLETKKKRPAQVDKLCKRKMKTEFTLSEIRTEYIKRHINGSRYRLEEMIEDMRLEKEMNNTPLSRFLDTCNAAFTTEEATGNFDRFGKIEKEENTRWALTPASIEILNSMNLTGFASKVRETVVEKQTISSKQLHIIF